MQRQEHRPSVNWKEENHEGGVVPRCFHRPTTVSDEGVEKDLSISPTVSTVLPPYQVPVPL